MCLLQIRLLSMDLPYLMDLGRYQQKKETPDALITQGIVFVTAFT